MRKNLLSKNWSKGFLFIALLFISYNSFNSSFNPPIAYTGATNESNCTACHAGIAQTSGPNWDAITLSGLPAGGYVPNTLYTLTLSGGVAATAKNGFSMTALTPTNAMAGTFAPGTNSGLQIGGGFGRTYINHTFTSGSSFVFNWTSPSSSVGTITFYLSWNSTNSNNHIAGDVVYVKSFSVAYAGNPPTAVITPSSTTICLGDTLYLQGSGNNSPTSYSWQFLGNVPGTSNLQNPKLVYTTVGTKQIRLTTSNAGGSSSPTSILITVNAKPTANFTASSTSICGDQDSVTLSANTGAGLTYLWQPGAINGQSIKVNNGGSYTVKVTNANNCFNTSTATIITKRTLPVSNFTASKDTVCTSDSILFTGSGTFQNYLFYRDTSLLKSGNDSVFNGKNLVSGNYKYRVFNGFCYSPYQTKFISVDQKLPAPQMSCGNSSQSFINYSWTNIPNAIGYQYSLDSGATWNSVSSTVNSLSVQATAPNQTKKLWLRALSNGICEVGETAVLACSNAPCPNQAVTIQAPKTICLNPDTGFVTVSVPKPTPNGNYSVRYRTITNFIAWAKAGESVNVPMSLGNNGIEIICYDSANLFCPIDTFVFVEAKTGLNPISTNIESKINYLCSYDKSFEIRSNLSPSADSILFYYINTETQTDSVVQNSLNDTSFVFNFSAFKPVGGFYAFNVKQWNTNTGCSAKSKPGVFKVLDEIKPSFLVTRTLDGTTFSFTNTTTNPFDKLRWEFGDGNIDTVRNIIGNYSYSTSGTYNIKLILSDNFSCSDTSSKTVVAIASSLNELEGINNLKIYPNPASDVLNVSFNTNGEECIKLRILDLNGKIIKTGMNFDGSGFFEEQLNLDSISKGIYLLEIATSKSVKHFRFQHQ
jgi:PKD repeat protein